jgi:pimeloyl-ACP methyl ester carboxylesterase
MGAALAVAVALLEPDRVERLLLVGPAGLPLTKPISKSLADCWKQMAAGAYASTEVVRAVGRALVAPRASYLLARAVRAVDLSAQLEALRDRGLRCDVVGCVGDTRAPVGHCRQIAQLAGRATTRSTPPEDTRGWSSNRARSPARSSTERRSSDDHSSCGTASPDARQSASKLARIASVSIAARSRAWSERRIFNRRDALPGSPRRGRSRRHLARRSSSSGSRAVTSSSVSIEPPQSIRRV